MLLALALLGLLAACGNPQVRTETPREGATSGSAVPHAENEAPAPVEEAQAPLLPAQSGAPLPALDDANSIFFAPGAAKINAAGTAKLREHAVRLKANPRLMVTLVGHTDHLGSRSYNLAIAEQRTAAVAEQLASLGVRRTQIRHYGIGNEKASTCRSADCRQRMRRVDLIYLE